MTHESRPEPKEHTDHHTPHPAEQDIEASAERPQRPSPRIYVASLSDYNNGRLHGVWLDAARSADDIYSDINAMLASSREPDAEEFAIHDYDEFGVKQIDEYDGIPLVAQIANGIAEHGDAFSAWADVHADDPDMLDQFSEHYLGHYQSLQDYAEEIIDDLGYHRLLEESIPESLRPYARIDTDALARDMYLDGSITIYPDEENGVWLFDTP